ncbi:ATP-binding protein [Vibrio maritimus]|uniref:ATP-binding protein n=1 Tax=Vibrio maritimus TaxID=990268 RepID=UPI004068660B
MNNFEKTYTSSLDTARDIAADLTDYWSQCDVASSDIEDLKLCVVELANNVFEHAYQEQEGKAIDVQCRFSDQDLVVTVAHFGLPLDEHSLETMLSSELPSLDPNDPLSWATSGRGFYIMNALLDDVNVQEREGMTTFTLSKSNVLKPCR